MGVSKKVLRAISVICVAALMLGAVRVTGAVFQHNHSASQNYREFWQDPAEYDVWFMGSSHTYHAFHPMELWESMGITSYDLAYPTSHMGQAYWTLMCALEEATPDLIVLDTYEIHLDKKLVDVNEKVHINFDEIPYSQTKVDALMDLTDGDTERVKEYLFPLSYRHYEWKERDIQEMFSPEWTKTKGSTIKNGIEDMSGVRMLDITQDYDEDNISMKYLRMFIEECERRDIDLLVVCLPYYGHKENQMGLNTTHRILADYDVPFIDIRWDGLIDPTYDMADLNHVNFSGGIKLNNYFGEYIREHYDLEDHRDDGSSLTDEWNRDYKIYREYLDQRLADADDLLKCLVLLSGDHYTASVWTSDESDWKAAKLIDNHDNIQLVAKEQLGRDVKIRPGAHSVVVISDRETGKQILIKSFDKQMRDITGN